MRTVVSIAAALLLAGACFGLGLILADDDAESAPAVRPPATPAAIAASPARYFRRPVVVGGEVTDVLGPRAFVLGGRSLFPGEGLLVVARNPVATPGGRATKRPVLQRDLAVVAGRVHVLDTRRLEKELGADLARRVERYDGDAVIVADAVSLTPRLRQLAGRATPAAIAAAPRRYYGSMLGVAGTVTDVLPSHAVVLDKRLLVLRPGATSDPREGQRFSAAGTVRRFDLDAFKRERLGDFDDRIFGNFSELPVLVAAGGA